MFKILKIKIKLSIKLSIKTNFVSHKYFTRIPNLLIPYYLYYSHTPTRHLTLYTESITSTNVKNVN